VKAQEEHKISSLTIRGIKSTQSNKKRPIHEKGAPIVRELSAMQIAQRDRLAAASVCNIAISIYPTELCETRRNTLPVSQDVQLALELVWLPDVIVIQKGEPLPASMISTEIDGIGLAGQWLIKNTQAGITG
jgi:hypothetical protein